MKHTLNIMLLGLLVAMLPTLAKAEAISLDGDGWRIVIDPNNEHNNNTGQARDRAAPRPLTTPDPSLPSGDQCPSHEPFSAGARWQKAIFNAFDYPKTINATF